MEWFMRPGDYDFSFIGMDEGWFNTTPSFGVAGGPDEVSLSDAGWEFVFDFASVYRMKPDIDHINAIRFLLANGPTEANNLPVQVCASLRGLSLAQVGDADANFTRSLALSLSGDQYAYDAFLDSVRIVRVVKSEYYLTELGKAWVLSATHVAQALIDEYNRRKKDQS